MKNLKEAEIDVSRTNTNLQIGDYVGFYFGNRYLSKNYTPFRIEKITKVFKHTAHIVCDRVTFILERKIGFEGELYSVEKSPYNRGYCKYVLKQ